MYLRTFMHLRTLMMLGSFAAIALSAPTVFAQSRLSCQSDLAQPDCSVHTGLWNPAQPLHVSASCQECSGGGSDIQCSPEEKVSAQVLGVETLMGQAVSGAFSQVGTCDFGILLLEFDGALAPGTEYRVTIEPSGMDKLELLQFTTSGGSNPTTDGGGTNPTADSGLPPTGDGGGAVGGDSDGDGNGDGDGDGDGATSTGGGSGEDDGCNCRVGGAGGHGAVGAAPLAGLLLAALLGLRRRRIE